MKEITVDELLRLQVDILRQVDTFCRNNSIPYTVFGGTCIGAVRHKGYIPWDDDIDIAMTRPHYDRFIQSFNGKVDHLEVLAPELNWNYYATYANVCDTRTLLDEGSNGHNRMNIGVKIDVFPIDAVPSDIQEYHEQKMRFRALWRNLYAKRAVLRQVWASSIKTAVAIIARRLLTINRSYAQIQKEIHHLIIHEPFEMFSYVDLSCYPWPTDSLCPSSVFEKYKDIMFEGITVSILDDYNTYLTRAYGDYMKLPPIEQQVPHHHFKAYWKD